MFQNTDTRNRPVLDELQMILLMLMQREKPGIFPPPSPLPARGNPEILALLKSLWHILELVKMKMIHLLFPVMVKNVFCSSSKYKAAQKLSPIYINKYCRGERKKKSLKWELMSWAHLLSRTESTRAWDLSLLFYQTKLRKKICALF